MPNLFDLIQSAQGGNAMNNLSQQFGLSPQETQNAVGALLPALSAGFNQQMQNPGSLSDILGQIMGGNHAQAYDANGDGIPDHLQTQGNDVLGSLFGSKDVSRQVASQAANSTGISPSVLQQMLPVIASMVLGGVSRQVQNQGLGGILGQIAGSLSQGGAPAGGNLGQAGQGIPAGPAPGASQDNPLGGLLGGLLGGILGGGQPQPSPAAPTSPQASPAQADPMQAGLDALRNMFEAGGQGQAQGQQPQINLQSILESMLNPQKR